MKTLLIDSNFLCHRAAYTVGNLEYNGVETGITYGFFNQLINVCKKVEPNNIIFFWDSKKSLRKELLPSYKEKRTSNKTEEEQQQWRQAYKQFSKIHKKLLPQIGLKNNFIQIGYESDDLIAQYVFEAKPDEYVVIASADDDLLQLLTKDCHIYNLGKNKLITAEDFEEEKGIAPELWQKVKMIAGCSSDNVPGVPGVGEKKAIQFLRGELNKNTKTYQKILDNKELIEFNKKLVVLPFEGTMKIHKRSNKNSFSMKQFLVMCREYGFSSFRNDEKKEEIRNLFSTI